MACFSLDGPKIFVRFLSFFFTPCEVMMGWVIATMKCMSEVADLVFDTIVDLHFLNFVR